MSSIAAGLLGVKDHALYNASKMAVKGMVTSFATDFGKRGITVNGVAPGGEFVSSSLSLSLIRFWTGAREDLLGLAKAESAV